MVAFGEIKYCIRKWRTECTDGGKAKGETVRESREETVIEGTKVAGILGRLVIES